MSVHPPHIASIPPGVPYLPTLVDALLDGGLIEGFAPGLDPLVLSSVTIWVPTRRAVRALAGEFVSRFDGEAALLPSIRALGDVDDDELFFNDAAHDLEPNLTAVIGPLERHLILSRLVNAWAGTLNPKQRDLYQGADIVMPSSLGDAVWFAADLARLMDTVATEEADWAALEGLVPQDYADWWKLTLEFLQIATSRWPDILAERQLEDGAAVRTQMLRNQAQAYAQNGSAGPVIAAGSTGSIPATAELLKTISGMPNGIIVLPGLDRDLDDETWQKIDLPDNDRDDYGAAPGHPQYGLKRLLNHIGVKRGMDDIPHLTRTEDEAHGPARVREQLVSEALRPSVSTGRWQPLFELLNTSQKQQALDGVSLVEAAGEREEALAIALALRETLEDPAKTCALVTPDRNLARRVAAEMRRFGVPVDDSAGQPLRNTAVGTLMRLVLQVSYAPADPVSLISLLKHPLALFGDTPQRTRHAARLFELAVLRGAIIAPVAGEFHALVSGMRNRVDAEKGRIHRSIKRFSPTDWADVLWLADTLDGIFSTPEPLPVDAVPLNGLARQSISRLEECGRDADGQLVNLYGSENGQALSQFLAELLDVGGLLEIEPGQWPDIFDGLVAQRVTRPLGGTHPRVAILGPLEARLQTFDRVVLGGLNEKAWPAMARNDPFLSRPMKTALNLPPPERRTGLAAHDFQMLLGMKEVVLARSFKADNAPSIASRWVQRLTIVAGDTTSSEMRARGQRYLDWARQIDQPEDPVKPCTQPRPTPAVELRPTGLSITEIETWIEDPYAIYARHILKLDPLAPLLRQADAREKGILYHNILEDFVRFGGDPHAEDALAELLTIARHHFNTTHVPAEQAAQWWPRFNTIAGAFLDWHREHLSTVADIHVELSGQTDIDLNKFTLRGRADRIDVLQDGRLALFDYKTGVNPKPGQVTSLDAPQLPLEAAMAARGAFGDALKADAAFLAYIRLRPDETLKVDYIGRDGSKTPNAAQLGDAAWKRLNELIIAYRNPKKDYRSKARLISDKGWESDFDHLARVREWSAVDDDGDQV